MEAEDGAELCFPLLLNNSCRKPTVPWPEAVIRQTLKSSISLLTVALNLLVIISISHFRQLHTPTNILLLSLAVSDILVGFTLPAEIFNDTNCWIFGDVMCSLYSFVYFIITSSSVGNMVLISIDRYIAICHPLHYSTRVTVRRVKLCVCLSWFCSVVYCTVILRKNLSKPGRYNFCHGECLVFTDFTEIIVDLILSIIVPISIIIILYMRVFVVAVSQARAMRSHITAVTLQSSVTLTKKSELKAARTLGVVVLAFLFCFFPYYLASFTGIDMSKSSLAFGLNVLVDINPSLNPIIYALFYPWFRKVVKLVVTLQILQPGSCEANVL